MLRGHDILRFFLLLAVFDVRFSYYRLRDRVRARSKTSSMVSNSMVSSGLVVEKWWSLVISSMYTFWGSFLVERDKGADCLVRRRLGRSLDRLREEMEESDSSYYYNEFFLELDLLDDFSCLIL